MKSYISDNGKVFIHVEPILVGEAELHVETGPGDPAQMVSFDATVLKALAEDYFDRIVALCVQDWPKLQTMLEEKGVPAPTLGVFGKQLIGIAQLRNAEAEQAVELIRCAGCGEAYEPPLYNGYVCACGGVYKDGKWEVEVVLEDRATLHTVDDYKTEADSKLAEKRAAALTEYNPAADLTYLEPVNKLEELPEGVEDHSAVYVGAKATVYVFTNEHGWETIKDHVDRERGEA